MPKLLIINVTCNQGSTGKIAEQVGLLMKNKGWDVYYAHGARRVNPSQLKTIPFSSVRAEYIHALRSRLFDGDGLGSVKETRYLVEQIKIIQPDIIHIHNIHGYYLNFKILFEYLNTTNIQVVKTLHDCWDFTGHCPHFVMANCEKWKSECFDCPLSKKAYPKSFFDMSTRNYRLKAKYIVGNKNLHLVPVSYWLEGLLRQSMYKGKDIRVIQNGIDLSVFKPTVSNKVGKFKILGVANVWSINKGYPDILLLRKKLDYDLFDITLVGLSQTQIKELPDGINGIASTSNQEELAKLYSQSDVLINPTYADTFPTVNLEALACGTPVITYKTGGSPESLSEDTGVVVYQGDVDGLAKAIVGLKYNSLSKSDCRKRAIDLFDKDICFNKYKDLFEELTGGGKYLILSVANVWNNNKGLNDLISLANELGDDEVLLMIGNMKNSDVRTLPEKIIYIPSTNSPQELSCFYNLADVVISASYAESFGLTIVEAMACGTPVIVYNNTGLANIPSEDTGLIVETGDVEGLIKAIRKIKNNPFSSEACRKRAEEHFDKDKCFGEYIELYNRLIRDCPEKPHIL